MISPRVERDGLEHSEHAVKLFLLAVGDERPVRQLADAEEQDMRRPAQTLGPTLGGRVLGRDRGGDKCFELVSEERLRAEVGSRERKLVSIGVKLKPGAESDVLT